MTLDKLNSVIPNHNNLFIDSSMFSMGKVEIGLIVIGALVLVLLLHSYVVI